MARFSKRSATSGSVTLNSSRKGGNTLAYWYFAKVGRKWIEFDIRKLAERTGSHIPPLTTSAELGTMPYEELLQRDLQRVADWCASINALPEIKAMAEAEQGQGQSIPM